MSKVIDLNKKRKGVLDEIVNTVDATELVEDEDFQVVSIFVMDDEMDMHSLGGFLNESSNSLFKDREGKPIEIAQSLLEGKQYDGVYKTPFPTGMFHLNFYEFKSEIDIDLATEIGLGVVEYNGKYHLYSPYMQNDPNEIVFEMMMLKVYAQLLNPEKIDINLAMNFDKVEDVVMSKMLINMPKHMSRLDKIFGR